MTKRRLYYIVSLSIAALVGGVIGWYIRITYTDSQPSHLMELRENNDTYHFINPLLLVDSPRQAPEYNDLKSTLASYINSEEKSGNASSISIYFRDLNSGKWSGVNEDDLYDPSSTLKVAVMMGYLNLSDSDPSILAKILPYTAKVDPGQYYKPLHPLQTGTYTIRELIEAMITDSDNNALDVLYNNDRAAFVDVLKTLSIPPPPTAETLDFLSPKMYASLFRTLYSATFLSHNLSEQALELLTYTTFTKGLVAGVPTGTPVAHKFGEHTDVLNDVIQSHQLHDCGIVYYGGSPYFLCVMTKGNDFSKLETVISTISKTVYNYVAKK